MALFLYKSVLVSFLWPSNPVYLQTISVFKSIIFTGNASIVFLNVLNVVFNNLLHRIAYRANLCKQAQRYRHVRENHFLLNRVEFLQSRYSYCESTSWAFNPFSSPEIHSRVLVDTAQLPFFPFFPFPKLCC